jgi:MerR family transcriptional regulator, copper efflux regulator
MNVTELARRTGVPASALRFYESAGVLPPARRSANGYRQYDDTDLCRVRALATLRGLGLPLDDAGRLAAQCASGRCDERFEDLLPRLAQRRADVAAARAQLDHLDAELARLETAVRTGQAQPILCRDEPAGEHERCA